MTGIVARGIRNNNPGNIDFHEAVFKRDPWVGELGLEDHEHARFTTFDTPEHGIRALCKILLTYQNKYGLKTIPEIINRWAPPVENDTGAYVDHVCRQLSVERDEPVSLRDNAPMLLELADAIIMHENGVQPYPRDVIEVGVLLALGREHM